MSQENSLIRKAYEAFNLRDADTVLTLMTSDVHWPNGWEGGYIEGKDAVKDYWTRQWQEIDPHVEPLSFTASNNGEIEVTVEQVVKSKTGDELFNGIIKHIYHLENGLIKSMRIVADEQ